MDTPSGLRRLAEISLGEPVRADTELKQFLDELLRRPPPAPVYVELLEAVRDPLAFVAGELARRYIDRPLPLENDEADALTRVTESWLKAYRGFAHCLTLDREAATPESNGRMALCVLRGMEHLGLAIIEHYRARLQIPEGLWSQLHNLYQTGEVLGLTDLPVRSPLSVESPTVDCRTTYVELLLTALTASYGLTLREQMLVRRWTRLLAPLAALRPILPERALPDFVVDPGEDNALTARAHIGSPPGALRVLDTMRLPEHIRKLRMQLRQNTTPTQLGLGSDCSRRECYRLLKALAQPWSAIRSSRKFRRHTGIGQTEVCCSPEAIHLAVSGILDEPHQGIRGAPFSGTTCEHWEIVNHSATGFCLRRRSAGTQVTLGQLLAIREHPGDPFLLARICWLMQERHGDLMIGLLVLPGIPQAIAARPAGNNTHVPEPFSRAFLLAPVTPMTGDPTLIIPHGWYRKGLVIETRGETLRRVRVSRLVHSGPAFDEVNHEAAPLPPSD